MIRKLLLPLVILFALVPAAARPADSAAHRSFLDYFGFYAAPAVNFLSADLRQLPSIATFAPRIANGSNLGAAAGLFAEFPYTKKLYFGLGASLLLNNGRLSKTFDTTLTFNGSLAAASMAHDVTANMASIMIEPYMRYNIWAGLSLSMGLGAALRLASDYAHHVAIASPDTLSFSNGSRGEDIANDLGAPANFGLSFNMGVEYRLPDILSLPGNFSARLAYKYGYMQLADNFTVDVNSIQLGLSFKFNHTAPEANVKREPLMPPPQELPAPPPAAQPKAVDSVATSSPKPTQSPAVFSVYTFATGRAAGADVKLDTIKIEKYYVYNHAPLLNYVFFDEDSSGVPARYFTLGSSEAAGFSIDNLHLSPAIDIYHNIINIIASRLKAMPAASITLTGYNSGAEGLNENVGLSGQRAAAIRDYLEAVWGIDSSRIMIITHDLPPNPSNQALADGRAENRRVEIASDDPDILAPVEFIDSTTVVNSECVKIHITSSLPDASPVWTVPITSGADTAIVLTSRSDTTMHNAAGWNINSNPEKQWLSAHAGQNLEYCVEYTNDSSELLRTPLARIPIVEKRNDISAIGSQSMRIERYNLVLFDFNKAELSKNSLRIIERIDKTITAQSRVTVTGYTDRIGDNDYNLQLSIERAMRAGAMLKSSNIDYRGMGKLSPLYDNDLPEGRFLNRTVEITVATPIR